MSGEAKAWDEGYDAAYHMARCWGHVDQWEDWPTNPYLAADEHPDTGDAVADVAAVLRSHEITEVGGGTASYSYWRCKCGDYGHIAGGVRAEAAAQGRAHVARAIVESRQP